jgi:dihydroxyacetone kinase
LSADVDFTSWSAYTDFVEVGEVAAQAERSTSPDPEIGLRAVARLRRLAAQLEADQVAAARRAGWTWQEIALGLGVTKQSVHRKYRHREERQ